MKQRTKWVLSIGILVILIGVTASLFFWWWMRQPLYTPGMVSAEKDLSSSLVPPEQDPTSAFWDMGDDVRLYHFAKGTGQNVLVLHGGPGFPDRQFWTGLDPLTDRFRFHFYDQRGCGDSSRPITGFGSKNYTANVRELNRRLGLGAQIADIERIRQILGDEKIMLLGHSFGGFIASLYAAEFPDRVAGLILLSPADMLVMPQESGGLFEIMEHELVGSDKKDFQAFMSDYFDFGSIFNKSEDQLVAANLKLAEYYTLFAGQLPNPEQHIESTIQARPGGWMVFGMYFSMGMAHDYRDALAKITAPTLIMRGELDFQPVSVEEMYQDGISDARLEIIPNATHFMYEERPIEFSQMLSGFLESIF